MRPEAAQSVSVRLTLRTRPPSMSPDGYHRPGSRTERMISRERTLRVMRALHGRGLKPLLFLVLLIVLWDVAIRVFRIPPYQIPAPKDVLITLYKEWPELLGQAWPTTVATLWGFLLSAAFGIPIAMLIAGSRTVEDYVYPLLVFSQSIPKV